MCQQLYFLQNVFICISLHCMCVCARACLCACVLARGGADVSQLMSTRHDVMYLERFRCREARSAGRGQVRRVGSGQQEPISGMCISSFKVKASRDFSGFCLTKHFLFFGFRVLEKKKRECALITMYIYIYIYIFSLMFFFSGNSLTCVNIVLRAM